MPETTECRKAKRRYFYCFLGMVVVVMLALVTAVWFHTPLQGIEISKVGRLSEGWMQGSSPVTLPCTLDFSGNQLYLTRSLSDIHQDTGDVFLFRTRYASIRVWADEKIIYEAAQGKAHALSSMWHFIPVEEAAGASQLQVELIRYEDGSYWELPEVLLDQPSAVYLYLIASNASVILFWSISILITIALLLIAVFMAGYKISGIIPIVPLAVFVFLSGQWIILDSKLTTLLGGNYAVSYFLSYAAFYLLTVPYLMYIQYMLNSEKRTLQVLTWAFIVNAFVCFLLHMLGLVSIRDTTFTVHLLIAATVLLSTRAFWLSVVRRREPELRCTFAGTLLFFVSGLISILLYYLQALPPANSTTLFAWSLWILILGMMLDAFSAISRFWKQKEYTDWYRRLASEDNMTGLCNRNAFEAYLRELAAAPPSHLLFVMFDLDNLKEINDEHGHHIGDQSIYMAAQCIKDTYGNNGRCYRIGGDEFFVILSGHINVERSIERCLNLLKERERQAVCPVELSFGWAEKDFQSGVAVQEKEISDLVVCADESMYRQKKKKKHG